MRQAVILWIAYGFGLGRIPIAPGTFGSLAGLLWFALLLKTGNLWLFLAGAVAALFLSVWICGMAERILRQKDPGSIVLDEIVALPFCFLGSIIPACVSEARLPNIEAYFEQRGLVITVVVFVLFRCFDILKPWPVRKSQGLPGGWGVTVDDVFAAFYVSLFTFPFFL